MVGRAATPLNGSLFAHGVEMSDEIEGGRFPDTGVFKNLNRSELDLGRGAGERLYYRANYSAMRDDESIRGAARRFEVP